MASFNFCALNDECLAALEDIDALRDYEFAPIVHGLGSPSLDFGRLGDAPVAATVQRHGALYIRGGFTAGPICFSEFESDDGQLLYAPVLSSGGPLLRLSLPLNQVGPDGIVELGLGSLSYSVSRPSPSLKNAYQTITRILKKRMQVHRFATPLWMGRHARKLMEERRAYLIFRGILGLPPGNDPNEARRLARALFGLPEI